MNDPFLIENNPVPANNPGTHFYDEIKYFEKNSDEPMYLSEIVNTLESAHRFKGEFPRDHVLSVLRSSTEFGCVDSPDPLFIPAGLMFDEIKIIIKLTKLEIQNGIFILENHLFPYISKYAFPYECRMFWGDIEAGKISGGLGYPESSSIGNSDYPDYINEYPNHPEMEPPLSSRTVFDFKDIYEKNNINPYFPECHINIKSFRKGIIEISFLSEEEQFLSKIYRKPYFLKMCRTIHGQIQKTGVLPNPYKAFLDFYAGEYLSLKNEIMYFPEPALFYEATKNLKVVWFCNRVFVVNQQTSKKDLFENFLLCMNPVDGRMETIDDVLMGAGSILNSNIISGYILDALQKNDTNLKQLNADIIRKYRLTQALHKKQKQIFDEECKKLEEMLIIKQSTPLSEELCHIRIECLRVTEISGRILSPLSNDLASKKQINISYFEKYYKILMFAESCIRIINYWQTNGNPEYSNVQQYLLQSYAHIHQFMSTDVSNEPLKNNMLN